MQLIEGQNCKLKIFFCNSINSTGPNIANNQFNPNPNDAKNNMMQI
jgi:hypothetical protein